MTIILSLVASKFFNLPAATGMGTFNEDDIETRAEKA